MALVLKNGAVFLHIPKTGGNWVTKALHENGLIKGVIPGRKHLDVDRVLARLSHGMIPTFKYYTLRSIGKRPKKPFIFCFVRHPFSWYESWFKYMSQSSRQWHDWGNEKECRVWRWHPNSVLNGLGAPDFNQFVRNVVRKRPGYVTELYGWYTKPQVDFIGKQENLGEDLIRVLKILDLKFDEDYLRSLPAFGASPKLKKQIEWDPDLREEVARLEHAGMVRYGYSSSGFESRGAWHGLEAA